MYKHLCTLLMIGIGLVACTTTQNNKPVQSQETVTIATTHPLPSATPLSSPSLVPTNLVTTTPLPKTIPTPTTSETTNTSSGSVPILIAAMDPGPYRRTFLPENIWWAEDSQTLYYQNIETHEAWAYDLSTRISTSIDYIPRSLVELESQIQVTLPDNASIVSLSPKHHYVLYRIPLQEPIPVPDDPSINPTPELQLPNHFTAELWLSKDGQDFNLGLVDNCFGLLFSPQWSANENTVIVNTAGSPDIACAYPVWLLDLDALTIGPFDSPWTQNYRVLDLSTNGDVFLVRSLTDRQNYLYNSKTKQHWVIPVDATDRMKLVETAQSPDCLVFELEFSQTILRDHIWYCEPTTGEITFLNTIEGGILYEIVSPDQNNVAFLIVNDFPQGNFYKDITPGMWILALPSN